MKRYALLFLMNGLLTFSVLSQNIFKGKVIGNDDALPLQGVTVTVGNNHVVATTDTSGEFTFEYASADFLLVFSHIGYEPLSTTVIGKLQRSVFILVRSNPFLSEAVVKAYERNARITDIPVAVSVLGKTDLERYSNTSFVAAVNTVPGVKMDERSPGSYRLSIRGNLLRSPFGVRNVKVYWNGIPFTDANGNTYINEIGFNNVGKMEIIKGPGSSMYGAGTGGVLLLTGKPAEKNARSISFNSSAGSYGLFTAGIAWQHAADNSNTALTYTHQQSDGYREQTNMRRDVANYTGTFDINNKQSVSANIFYSDLYYQTPGGLTQAQVDANPRQARSGATPSSSAINQLAVLYLKTFYAGLANEYQFNNRWSNSTGVYVSNTRFRNPTIRNYEIKTEQGMGARTMTQYHKGIFKLNFGGEYQYGFTNTSVFGNKFGNIDTLQNHDEIDAVSYNLFAQADFSFLRGVILNVGVSYNNYHYGFMRLNQLPSVKQQRNFDPELMPRISALYKLWYTTTIYATVSKGFSPPSIDEIHSTDGDFNKALNAETGINYELGVRSDIIKNKLFVDASYYIFGLSNTIIRTDPGGAEHFINAGKTNQRGFEFAINYYPLRDSKCFFQTIKLWSNYTNTYARFKEYKQGTSDSSGNKLTGTPPNVLAIGADINTKPGLYANLTYNFTDEIPLNDANTVFAMPYNLFFARLGYKVALGKAIQTEIFCAFDKSFNNPYSLGNDLNADAIGKRFFNPAAPQNFYGGLKIKFAL